LIESLPLVGVRHVARGVASQPTMVVVVVDPPVVVVEVVLAGGAPALSNAPMSQTATVSPSPSCGRDVPRWSVAGGGQPVPASRAGLPATSVMVSVGPP
jgi:hypothetical protein